MPSRSARTSSALTAYVLHRYDWSESSLILDVFTQAQGRIAVAAKGAKRPYSQLRAVLLPFQRISLSLGRAPADASDSEVHSLRAAEWAGGPPMLSGAALFSGFYLNELLMRLLARHDPHALLFDVYASTLEALGQADDADAEVALRAFELTLLKEIGLLPELSVETLTQHPVEPDGRYSLLVDSGVGSPRRGEGELSGRTLINLQAALEHGSLAALQQACAAALPELKGVLRTQLHYHLGSSVLRTRQVMIEAQNLER
jgi:DNA repair protein RecO (recombination protein O)